MKKLFMTMLTILTSGAAFALPVGNPSEASLLCDGVCWEGHCGDMCDPCLTWCDAFSVRLGFYGDYVFNRHLQVNKHGYNKDIDRTMIFTNAAYVAGNFWDRFDIFATFGATRLVLDGNSSVFNVTGTAGASGNEFTLESSSDFSWSVGLRGTLWECGCTSIGGEFQYLSTRPHISRTANIGGAGVTVPAPVPGVLAYPPSSINMKWYEWQFGLGISYRINFVVPYAAIKWSSGKADLGNATTIFSGVNGAADLKAENLCTDRTFGYAIGATIVDCDKLSITGEVRFSDETAAYVNGQFRF